MKHMEEKIKKARFVNVELKQLDQLLKEMKSEIPINHRMWPGMYYSPSFYPYGLINRVCF